jgi:hypothetical protein
MNAQVRVPQMVWISLWTYHKMHASGCTQTLF